MAEKRDYYEVLGLKKGASEDEIKTAIDKMIDRIPADKLWVNPDCGLKTRGEKETIPSLKNLVNAAKRARA